MTCCAALANINVGSYFITPTKHVLTKSMPSFSNLGTGDDVGELEGGTARANVSYSETSNHRTLRTCSNPLPASVRHPVAMWRRALAARALATPNQSPIDLDRVDFSG